MEVWLGGKTKNDPLQVRRISKFNYVSLLQVRDYKCVRTHVRPCNYYQRELSSLLSDELREFRFGENRFWMVEKLQMSLMHICHSRQGEIFSRNYIEQRLNLMWHANSWLYLLCFLQTHHLIALLRWRH